MIQVKNSITGERFEAEHLVWTNDDTNGFTPRASCMTYETATRYAHPDRGIYNDRKPWAWDEYCGDDHMGCFWPVRILKQ